MKILMLGWEFPPFFAGGVGTVCYELTKNLVENHPDCEITFLMPYGPEDAENSHVNIKIANNIVSDAKVKFKKIKVDSLLGSYISSEEYERKIESVESLGKTNFSGNLYGKNLLDEVKRFAAKVKEIVKDEKYDIIHAHDWTTLPAAIAAKEATGAKYIAHVHITEFDKSGGEHAHPEIYAVEKEGMDKADKIIAVSKFVKSRLTEQYHQNPNKIDVIYNGASSFSDTKHEKGDFEEKNKIVLFLGRVTLQKGPEYFIDAAKIVSEHMDNVKFVFAGTGDMLSNIIEKSAAMGLSDKIIFAGVVKPRENVEKIFSMADVFVMPSVSEPFGIVPLEAIAKGTPTIISNQSGISEVLVNTMKVDFWNVKDMANKIIGVLKYKELQNELSSNGLKELSKFKWDEPTSQIVKLYGEMK